REAAPCDVRGARAFPRAPRARPRRRGLHPRISSASAQAEAAAYLPAREARQERDRHLAGRADEPRSFEAEAPPEERIVSARRRPIYLDHAATTPVDPAVAAEMMRCLGPDGVFANPSSSHAMGRAAARVGAGAGGIVFVAGATEANNLAIKGVIAAAPAGRRHLVTTRIEHTSVLDTAAAVEREGVAVTYVGCDSAGLVAPEEIERA